MPDKPNPLPVTCDTVQPYDAMRGIKRLYAAIIERAIADALSPSKRTQFHKLSAYNWLMEKSSYVPAIEERMVTFEYACEVCGYQPQPIRDEVTKHWHAGTEIVLPNCKPEPRPKKQKVYMISSQGTSQIEYWL